jgi:hypothetical protein
VAERIPPGFNIPIGFYDGPEVRSIPKRIRAHAVGVFALAGNYSASRLSDGYVDNETLAEFGCSPGVREALKNTLGREGQPDPIWAEAPNGIRFAKWGKWQRTNAEVTAHRDAEAARKRDFRARKRKGSGESVVEIDPKSIRGIPELDPKQSANTLRPKIAQPADIPECPTGQGPDVLQSETETETELSTRGLPHADTEPKQGAPMREERGQERGRSDPVDVSASRLVATLIPSRTPAAVKTALRLSASQLIVGDGLPPEVVAEALRRWQTKPDAGPGLLPHIASTVLREGTAPPPKSKQRDWAELAREAREAEQLQQPSRKAIES